MCTLTLVAENNGYLLAMNRDERLARGGGMNPEEHARGAGRAIYPGDGAGGTWIGVNESGVALALLNWNDPVQPVHAQSASRGQVIPALIHCRSMAEFLASLSVLVLDSMRPFRMVGIFPLDQAVRELRWDSRSLEVRSHSWRSQHWFSSGLSDEQAQQQRGETCANAWNEGDAGTSMWLKKLHASHSGGSAFSICVHRGEVATLSYTEIFCAAEAIRMRHTLGSPCAAASSHSVELPRIPVASTDPSAAPARVRPLARPPVQPL